MRSRNEQGSALVELTWLGLLLLVPLLWIVLSVFEVQRGAFAVSGAARARASPTASLGAKANARPAARAAARQVLVDHGVGDQPLGMTVSCAPAGDCHAPGATITVDLRSRVNLPLLPDVLGGGAPSFALNASHSVPVGQFRDTQ